MAQASSNPAQLEILRAEIDKGHAAAVEEMTARYRHWKKVAQVRVGAEPAVFANKVFELYFAGVAPFEKPRQREHLPDAFIYVEMQQLATQHKHVCFVSDDARLRECVATLPGVEVFTRLFDVLRRKPLPATERHALIASLSDRNAIARRLIEEELPGLRMWVSEKAHSVAAVQEINSLEMDRAGVVPLENGLNLTVWKCSVIAEVYPALDAYQSPGGAAKTLRIRCDVELQLILFAGNDTAAATAVEELDLFEYENLVVLGERPFEPGVIEAPRIDPRVSVYHRARLDETFRPRRDGLIVVGGSRADTRREVASYLARTYLQFHPGLCIATFKEIPPCHSFVAVPAEQPSYELAEWIEHDVHLKFRPLALVIDYETPQSLTQIIQALNWTAGLLIIATVANASGATDLIRRVYNETPSQEEPQKTASRFFH